MTYGYADPSAIRDLTEMNMRNVAVAAAGLLAACSTSTPAPTPAATTAATAAPSGSRITPGSEEDLVANIGDRVLFDYNKAELRDTARATLDKQAAWLARFPQDHVLIAGNADERQFSRRARRSGVADRCGNPADRDPRRSV